MKCYQRLIYKQCPSQVFVAQFLGYFPKRFTYLCRALYCRTPYWCTVLENNKNIWSSLFLRLQNSPYFCVFKYARAVKQKVWNEAENRERDWGETVFFSLASHAIRACEARALGARKTLTPRFTDFFTDFEKKNRLFCSLTFPIRALSFHSRTHICAHKHIF